MKIDKRTLFDIIAIIFAIALMIVNIIRVVNDGFNSENIMGLIVSVIFLGTPIINIARGKIES